MSDETEPSGRGLLIAYRTCALFAFALAIFSWWGLMTTAGSRVFDEMSGMIPFAAGMLSIVMALISLLLYFLRRPAIRK